MERIKTVLEKCEVNCFVQVRNPTTDNYESKPIYEFAASHMGCKTFIGVTYRLIHNPIIVGKMTGHVEGRLSVVIEQSTMMFYEI